MGGGGHRAHTHSNQCSSLEPVQLSGIFSSCVRLSALPLASAGHGGGEIDKDSHQKLRLEDSSNFHSLGLAVVEAVSMSLPELLNVLVLGLDTEKRVLI